LIPDKAILCYICGWRHVYFLVGGLVPGSSEGLVGWYCCSSYGVAKLSAPSVLSLTPVGTSCSVQWLAVSICLCYLSGSGRASRETRTTAPGMTPPKWSGPSPVSH
jgi:hypothetical protein